MPRTYVKEHMARALENHVLTQVKVPGGPIQMFYLHKKDARVSSGILVGREMSTLFMFTPEGIVITGDLCPRACPRGCISTLGYSLKWFTDKLSEDYLCEKFLQRGVYADTIREWLEDRAKNDENVQKRATASELLEEAPSDNSEAENYLWECLQQFGEEYDGQAQDFEPADAGWLCALQQRFSALYRGGQVTTEA